MKGGNKIHPMNCYTCDIIVTGNKVKRFDNTPFGIRGIFDCTTTWAVFSLACQTCKQHLVGTSTQAVGKKVEEYLQNSVHTDHEV